MKLIAKYYVFTLSILSAFSLTLGQSNYLPIVPEPQIYQFNNTNYYIRNESIKLNIYCQQDAPIKFALNELISISKNSFNAVLSKSDESERIIYIGIKDNNEEFNLILRKNSLYTNENIKSEGYKLLINTNEIILLAEDNKGIFYGIQSLKQLFRASKENDSIPGVLISDWPSFKYRAISDDISRGPIPTMDYMKYQIRRLSEMKINTYIHYVEHVVKTKRYPEFAPDDGSLTIDEWKEIADYALSYNITVIGGFQSFGHFQKILETPEYAHLGESGTLISPVKPESYEFLENIYDEMIPAFHSDIFNINCDETFDLGKEDSKQLVDSIGYAEVYYQHIMKLYNIVKKYDKRIIMWGDILLEYPYLIDKLPKDVLIGTWNYDAKETFKEFIDPFKDSGNELWVVPGVLNSRRIYPDFNKAFNNIKVFVEEGYEAGATGVLNCFWDDGSTGLFSNDWYGAAYGADKSWNVKSSDNTFDNRYSNGSLGTNDTQFFNSIRKLNELRFYELTDGMTDKFLFVELIPEVGEEIKISVNDLDICLDIVNEAQVELEKAQPTNYIEDKEYLQFIIDLYRTLIQERFDLLEASKLYSDAEKYYSTDPFLSRKKIISSLELLTKIISKQEYLKNQFELLWLKENHTYALDWITDKYETKINKFKTVKRLLFESLKNFDSSKPIISLANVRLKISKLPGKYFTEWMMINPLPNKDLSAASSIDYLIDMGGESSANPKVTHEFYFEDEKYRWRRVVSKNQDILNLDEIFDHKDTDGVMYAFANITVDEANKVEALASFGSGIEIFINGTSVYKSESNLLTVDQERITIPLNEGKNNLLLKITKLNGDWGFSFRLPESEVRNSKNRYKIINKDFIK
jgi:hypothetical protein